MTDSELVPSSPSTMQPFEERNWAMLCHLSSLAGFVIPFGNILGPLLVWLLKRDESSMVDQHGKASLNFHISMMIYMTVAMGVTMVAAIIPVIGWLFALLVGIPAIFILAMMDLIYIVIGSVKAKEGKEISYPITIRFLK